ncbi:MAG: glycine dehydrogenase (aminomethyl-transferring) [Saprospirales bacterium]|nr:MAG: glycine dehydrogenase (aminomethyl-transferring) [Saprospirales bacterium]
MNLLHPDKFSNRHIGIWEADHEKMFKAVGVESAEQLIDEVIPAHIRIKKELDVPSALNEHEYIRMIRSIGAKNKVFRSYIGLGYSNTITPSVILRNIFNNPGWYTQYTPYQAEISQGRLEALLNFQTMVSELTGLPVANASLLDEGTAAAEAMGMFFALSQRKFKKENRKKFFVDINVFPQTLDVLRSRALPLGIEISVGNWMEYKIDESYFGALLQYPNGRGEIEDYRDFVESSKGHGVMVAVAADLMSLCLLSPPGEWDVEAVVGNTQRFGVPLGAGGPHAAYFATKEDFKRQIPGRIIGVSKDRHGNLAYRMALQTREQHIKREKATSNICTAQALLAIMAGMYGVYHGPKGLRAIAASIHAKTNWLNDALSNIGFEQGNKVFFDTLCYELDDALIARVKEVSEEYKINFFYRENLVQISLDETVTRSDLMEIYQLMAVAAGKEGISVEIPETMDPNIPDSMMRKDNWLAHPIFNKYRTETEMMRYIKSLENKDLSLMHSMIPLGSCTMKLNAATQLLPVSYDAFSEIHPFAPVDQMKGYEQMISELSNYLCEITGFSGCSFMPNSGAQGEFAGLMVIRAYHHDRGAFNRDVALIPSSAHGTNPASAVMAGMQVVVVKCDENGNVDLGDLREKAEKYSERLSALMVTYPSTHGVFEESIVEICDIIHDNGGLVYMDGANMNAQVGYTNPGNIHADVCHLNLHKTFAIPHGGGGPGMGPICVNDKLLPYLPNHPLTETGGPKGIPAVASAPYGSASILLISHAYIRLLGKKGLKDSTMYAILNANYIRARLESAYEVLYVGKNGHCAHEVILDLRPYKAVGISAEDVAKRLIDYGFHAPTLSFPVAGTIMIEPTESESLEELDLFVDAMLKIKEEIDEVARGEYDQDNNVLKNAPHTLKELTAITWDYPYSREKAAYPLDYLKSGHKFWVQVGRVDNAYGDRNLVCTCPPMEAYESME